MTSERDDVVIVIPCLNEERSLPALLAQLRADTPGCRIVVADGGSSDRSRAIVAAIAADDPRVALLDNPRRIQSAGINLAVRTLGDGARWLVRIDAHCDYPRDYVARLLAAADVTGASSVVVPMVSRGTTCVQVAAAAAQNSRLGTGGSPHRHVGRGRFVDHGHHALIDMALFQAVGGYRADMTHNEDAELDLRLVKAGGRLWLEPALALTYYPRSSLRALGRQYWSYGRGRARTLRLHRVRPKLRQLLPLAVPAAALLAILTPFASIFALPLFGWAGLTLVAGVVVGARAGGGCALGAGVAAMTMHMAWGCGFVRGLLAR